MRRKSQSTRQTARSWIGCERAGEGDNDTTKLGRKLEFALAVLMKAKCWKGGTARSVLALAANASKTARTIREIFIGLTFYKV